MDQSLKQRLVGAAVLVLAVVWLVPELFESEDETRPVGELIEDEDDEFSSRIVPLEEPEQSSDVIEEVQIVEINADKTPVMTTESAPAELETNVDLPVDVESVVGETALLAVSSEETLLAPQDSDKVLIPFPRSKPGSGEIQTDGERLGLTVWAIQLGSFGESTNALGLRDRLRARGYAAFVRAAYSSTGAVTRVFVGPELYREKADSVRDRLYTETTLDGLVVRYPGG